MNKAPAFQFYANNWLGSPNIMMMTPEEEGAYIHLLALLWNSDDCSLPDDDKVLASLSRLNEKWFNGSGKKIMANFIKKDGKIFNKRLLFERRKQAKFRKERSEAGKKGAKNRWDKEDTANGSANGSAIGSANGSAIVLPMAKNSFEFESDVLSLNIESEPESDIENKKTNLKKERGFIRGKEKKNILVEDSIEFQLSKKLFSLILKNNPTHKQPNFNSWALEIDKMIRLDNRTSKQIEYIIDWCQQDEFWSTNILSTKSLRKQFDRLIIKAGKQHRSIKYHPQPGLEASLEDHKND
jgi:uncharacterized protein YdaU (DUF1376 family)